MASSRSVFAGAHQLSRRDNRTQPMGFNPGFTFGPRNRAAAFGALGSTGVCMSDEKARSADEILAWAARPRDMILAIER
jgi:hypothetical protein